jgi:hypothetical protein
MEVTFELLCFVLLVGVLHVRVYWTSNKHEHATRQQAVPTFVTCNRQEVIDITIATFYAGNFIRDWHVTEEVRCSDHRYIQFNITGIDCSVEFYRNPRRTNWESFRTDLGGHLRGMKGRITNHIDLEIAARQFQDAINLSYTDNCPSVAS